MITYVDYTTFSDSFYRHGREKQFSENGLFAIYQYLEDLDPNMQLDVIAICCDFREVLVDDDEFHQVSEDNIATHHSEGVILWNS
jgi:hypothetical protein